MVCPSVATAVANASVYRLVTMAFSELAEGMLTSGASREYSFLCEAAQSVRSAPEDSCEEGDGRCCGRRDIHHSRYDPHTTRRAAQTRNSQMLIVIQCSQRRPFPPPPQEYRVQEHRHAHRNATWRPPPFRLPRRGLLVPQRHVISIPPEHRELGHIGATTEGEWRGSVECCGAASQLTWALRSRALSCERLMVVRYSRAMFCACVLFPTPLL